MRRLVSLLDHALGAALRRRSRNAAIVVGLTLVVGLAESVTMLTGSLTREYERGTSALPDLVVQSLVGGRPSLVDPASLDALRSRAGVRAVTPRIWGYLYVPSIEANVTIVARSGASSDARIVGGRLPRESGEAALGRTLADALGIRIGDTLALPDGERWSSYRVVGVFRAATALRTADLVVVGETDARRLLHMPDGSATDLAIGVSSDAEIEPTAHAVHELLPTARILERTLLARTYALTFGARSGLVAIMLLPAIAALLLLAWDRLTGLGEDERREIAILKLVGFSTGDVLRVRMFESGLVAFVGTSLGFAAAYAFVFVADAPLLADALLGWSRLAPTIELVPAVGAGDLMTLLGLVVVPFVAVSIVPAFLAAMRDPIDAWRGP